MKLEELRRLSSRLSPAPKTEKEMVEALRTLGLEPGTFYQELEMSSRFVDTHHDASWSNTGMTLHSHDFYEILYCCNSCGAEYLLGDKRYRLQKGDILFVPPGVGHRPILPENPPEPYHRDVLWLSRELMDRLVRDHPDESADFDLSTLTYLLRTEGTDWEHLGILFRRGVQQAERRPPSWEIAVLGNALQILAYMRQAAAQRDTKTLRAEAPQLTDRIMAYVEQHLAEKLTLADIAHQFFVSESTISQAFREKLGVSYYRHVTQRRLIAAKSLIQQGVPLEDVGRQVGFADHSTFYRAFRKEYGIAPRQYRKMTETAHTERELL